MNNNNYTDNNGNGGKVNPNLNLPGDCNRLALGNFDLERIAAYSGGKISREEIGEIFAATTQNEALIDYLLRSWVKDPRRIAVHYHGTLCRLLDYEVIPGIGIPLHVSRVSGSVLSESWGKHRVGGLRHGIFDVAAVIFGLTEKKDFPKVYFIVRKAYEAWKHLPVLTKAEAEEIKTKIVQRAKDRLLSCFVPFYSDSIRKAPSAQKLWQVLPSDVRDEEFGGSFRRFREFLEYLAEEDPTEGPFRVSCHPYGKITRFRLSAEGYIPASGIPL
jgi:hypothetical protein